MFGRVRIRQHERGVWLRHGNFHRLLVPGKYRMWSRLWSRKRDRVDIADTLQTRFEHPLLDLLAHAPDIERHLHLVELTDGQRALVWKDGRLAYILGPGRHAFWRTPARLHVETFDISAVRFEHPQLDAIVNFPAARNHLDGVEVAAHEIALLYRDGVRIGRLAPGRHVFWKGSGRVTWTAYDLREQLVDVAGQEIMTADKVSLRLNLLVTYQVVEPEKAAGEVADVPVALYREAQLALRALIGTRLLDALLADKETISRELQEALATRAAQFGVAVRSVGLRDIILPGDMKAIFNAVIAAEKQAQANLIRRREETAAIRNQANTARLLAENPVLARLRELELLQEALAGAKATFVFGSGDLAQQLTSLIAGTRAPGEKRDEP